MKKLLVAVICLCIFVTGTACGIADNTKEEIKVLENVSAAEQLTSSPIYHEIDIFNTAHINWHGRYYKRDNFMHFNLSASGFEVTFKGTYLKGNVQAGSLSVTSGVYLTVYIDGEDNPMKATDLHVSNNGTFTFVEGLTDDVHTVKIIKRCTTSAKMSLSSLTTDGHFTSPPKRAERRIEIIGASTSVGSGVRAPSTDVGNNTSLEDMNLTTAALAARLFGAEVSSIGQGGWAVNRNNSDPDMSVPKYYDYADIRQTAYTWDHQLFIPDLVVFLLCSNDSAYIGDAKTVMEREEREQAFIDAYITFIDRIKTHYPNTKMLITYGALGDTYVRSLIPLIKQYYVDKGEDFVDILELRNANAVDGYGSGYHPNAITNLYNSEVEATKIEQMMGWDRTTNNLTRESVTFK